MDVATLAADYEETLEALSERPLPSYRVEELRGRVETVLRLLSEQRVVPAAPLQRLLCAVTEAVADVQDATLVADDDGTGRSADDRGVGTAVPGADDGSVGYRLTPTERRATLDTLVRLLFTVVETPTPGDERGVDGLDSRVAERQTTASDGGTGPAAAADASGDATDAAEGTEGTGVAEDAEGTDAAEGATEDVDTTEISAPIETTYAGPE